MATGKLVLFAADSSGTATAVDLDAGVQLWRQAKSGESFQAGVTGIIWAAAAPAFRTAYANPNRDLLLLASITGRVLAVDAATGDTLWTVDTGAPLRAPAIYDPATNRFYIPTQTGVRAYDMGPSSPTTPAVPLAGWHDPGGVYSLYCVRTYEAETVACVDRSTPPVLRMIDKATGNVRGQLTTSLSNAASSLTRISGSTPGFVVGNSRQVVRIAIGATPYALSEASTWTSPDYTMSPAVVFATDGYVVVGGSDGSLHKLSLDRLQPTGSSQPVPRASPGALLGPVGYDITDRLFVFGTSEGRVWAIKNDF
jgi:outer membrane protein assembly factor BamB